MLSTQLTGPVTDTVGSTSGMVRVTAVAAEISAAAVMPAVDPFTLQLVHSGRLVEQVVPKGVQKEPRTVAIVPPAGTGFASVNPTTTSSPSVEFGPLAMVDRGVALSPENCPAVTVNVQDSMVAQSRLLEGTFTSPLKNVKALVSADLARILVKVLAASALRSPLGSTITDWPRKSGSLLVIL